MREGRRRRLPLPARHETTRARAHNSGGCVRACAAPRKRWEGGRAGLAVPSRVHKKGRKWVGWRCTRGPDRKERGRERKRGPRSPFAPHAQEGANSCDQRERERQRLGVQEVSGEAGPSAGRHCCDWKWGQRAHSRARERWAVKRGGSGGVGDVGFRANAHEKRSVGVGWRGGDGATGGGGGDQGAPCLTAAA